LGRDSILEAANSVRVFEAGPAWFRLNQLISTERKAHVGKVMEYSKDLTMTEVAFAQGVEYAFKRLNEMLHKICQEGADLRNE